MKGIRNVLARRIGAPRVFLYRLVDVGRTRGGWRVRAISIDSKRPAHTVGVGVCTFKITLVSVGIR